MGALLAAVITATLYVIAIAATIAVVESAAEGRHSVLKVVTFGVIALVAVVGFALAMRGL